MDSKQNSMPILKESHKVMAEEVIQTLHDGQQKSWRKYFKNMFQDIEEQTKQLKMHRPSSRRKKMQRHGPKPRATFAVGTTGSTESWLRISQN